MNVLRLAANVADTETITIGDEVYEIDTDATYTAGRIPVDCSGGVTPTLASAAIVAAINGNTKQGIIAVAISVNEILIYTQASKSARLLATTETLAGSNNAWGGATMYCGTWDQIRGLQMYSKAASAQEVAIGNMHFMFPFAVAAAIVNVRTAAGIPVAWVGATTISGARVTVDNTGATDWAATDVVTVLAAE